MTKYILKKKKTLFFLTYNSLNIMDFIYFLKRFDVLLVIIYNINEKNISKRRKIFLRAYVQLNDEISMRFLKYFNLF